MAWRALARKGGCYSLTKSLIVTYSIASASKCRFDDSSAKALSASVIHLLGHHFPLAFRDQGDDLTLFARKCSVSSELLARRMEDESIGLKTSRRGQKGKFSKRKKEDKPPVDAPYVPPKLKRSVKSLPDKTIEIFEGMTIIELAKRCGESTSTIQNIIINVGERADSELVLSALT